MNVDFGKTAADYARFRAGFPDSFFERLETLGIAVAARGDRIVDLGTGTGALARGFARRGFAVRGIDVSPPLLEQARALAAADEVEVEWRLARAEETGLPDASADLVSAGQCWHWFDRPAAAREAARILRPEGRILIAHFDWIPLPGNLVEATESLIERHNPEWKLGGGRGVHPRWLRDLGEAGFRTIECFSYDVDVAYTPGAWRGRIRASAGVGGSLPPAAVEAFDRDHARLLAGRFPAPMLAVPHRVFAVFAHPPQRRIVSAPV